MRRLLSYGAALALLASCGRPLTPPECYPTTIQPAADSQVVIIGRLAGCNDLVVVSLPGQPFQMYMQAGRLNLSYDQVQSLPIVPRGEG